MSFKNFVNTKLFKNSSFGIVSSIIQNVFVSIFFVVIARKYSKDEFANYIVANTIYSFLMGFSALGLGHWFIREMINKNFKDDFLNKFFKMQFIIGILFYIVSIIMTFLIYNNPLIRSLSILMSINIIFDNLIYVIKNLNIAEQNQKKTFVLTIIESFLKCLLACCLFFYLIPIFYLALILLFLRFLTLNLFIKYGSSNKLNLFAIFRIKISYQEIFKIISSNWSFVIMGTLSIVYWRMGNLIVSKYLTNNDIANYEVSFKLLSLAFILPTIVSTSIYPMLLKALNESFDEMKKLYSKIFIPYSSYGILAYSFVCSFSDIFIPFLFGNKFGDTSVYCREMFLIILIFPTFLLQAELLISMKLEKLDMICNIVSIVINLLLILIGLNFFKSLSVINYSIFLSIFIFHFVQDVILIRKKVANYLHVFMFYISIFTIIAVYKWGVILIDKHYLFVIILLIFIFYFIFYFKKKNTIPLDGNMINK